MNVYEIPVVGSRPTSFPISLAGSLYIWRLYWNVPAQCWIVNIADQSANPLISGIPLVTGANLLEQYGYTALGRATLFVLSDHQPQAVPDFTNLGTTGHLYYLPPKQ
jgi:hypothetical protein